MYYATCLIFCLVLIFKQCYVDWPLSRSVAVLVNNSCRVILNVDVLLVGYLSRRF